MAVAFGLPNNAMSGELDPPCSEVAANCQVTDLSAIPNGFNSTNGDIFAADNFTPTSTATFTHVCFWGLYNLNTPGTDDFVISIYNDNSNAGGGAVAGYPVAPALATYTAADLTVTRADTGFDGFGLDVYEFSATVNAPALSLTAGNCYWIEISNNGFGAGDAFFVVADAGGDSRYMQRGTDLSWGYGDVGTGLDLAICVNGGLTAGAPSCAIPGACNIGTQDCAETNKKAPGCSDPECCTLVCIQEPVCCLSPWDEICTGIAIASGCAVAPYECAAGGPANDCATSPAALALDGVDVAYDLTTANTDGASINVQCNGGQSNATFDVWYEVVAPSNGQITISTCGTTEALDLVVNIHDIGDGTYDPQDVLDEANWFDCDDDGCCPGDVGCAAVRTFDCVADTHYLIRVGTWNGSAAGAGFINATFSPQFSIWNTGVVSPVLFNGTLTNLGFSSGSVSAANPQRWLAQPFTLPAVPAGGSSWQINRLTFEGFTSGAPETMDFIVWARDGIGEAAGPPVDDSEMIVSGSQAFAAEAGNTYTMDVDFRLPPGDYWMTFHSTSAVLGNQVNWFANAQSGPDGIPNLGEGIAVPVGEAFMWRCPCFNIACAAPGFVAYNLGAAYVVGDAGQDPQKLYTACFRIIGEPQFEEPACQSDCVGGDFMPPGDGEVDGADLGTLLGDWGPCPDCCSDSVNSAFEPTPDGEVDGADLGTLLNNWGPCS